MAAGALVVTIDRLPAWILPAYGSTWLATPALDRLASRGVVLDQLLGTHTRAAANIAALAGGDGGLAATGTDRHGGWTVITDDPDALPARLAREAGRIEVAIPGRRAVADDPLATVLGRLATAAATAVRGGRRCVWCHATALGRVWDAPEGFRDAAFDPDDPPPRPGAGVPTLAVDDDTDPDVVSGIRQLFAGQVMLLDHCLAPLLDTVPAGWCVLVAGVRGMALGIHRAVGPSDDDAPFGEIVRLPALVVAADGSLAAQRCRRLAVPADVGTTMARLLGAVDAEGADPWDGCDLVRATVARSAPARDRVVIDGGRRAAVATAAWHLVTGPADGDACPAPRLFAKPDDYFEISDVADRSPAIAEELAALVAPWLGMSGASPRDADAAANAWRAAWSAPLSAAAVGDASAEGA